MKTNSKKHPVLNAILSVLNLSLEVVIALIALGVLIGLYGVLS
jgi:ABC-type dipeptide/oligopeptide/nickel transport system permease component